MRQSGARSTCPHTPTAREVRRRSPPTAGAHCGGGGGGEGLEVVEGGVEQDEADEAGVEGASARRGEVRQGALRAHALGHHKLEAGRDVRRERGGVGLVRLDHLGAHEREQRHRVPSARRLTARQHRQLPAPEEGPPLGPDGVAAGRDVRLDRVGGGAAHGARAGQRLGGGLARGHPLHPGRRDHRTAVCERQHQLWRQLDLGHDKVGGVAVGPLLARAHADEPRGCGLHHLGVRLGQP
mmetsp:Transcript_34073/g.109436  ORF Transcript_34073/g.109436 Transcript_34073/m.109436 type:complete len:239 (+) Transcript_34073:445-1161(+)